MGLPNQYGLYIQSVALLFYLQSTVCNGRVIIKTAMAMNTKPVCDVTVATSIFYRCLEHKKARLWCGVDCFIKRAPVPFVDTFSKSQEVMYVMLALNSPPIHSPPQPYPFRLYYQSTTAGVSCVTYRLTLKAPLILAPPPACTHTFLYSTCWQQIPVYCQENSSCCWLCLTEQHWLCACMFSKYACGV